MIWTEYSSRRTEPKVIWMNFFRWMKRKAEVISASITMWIRPKIPTLRKAISGLQKRTCYSNYERWGYFSEKVWESLLIVNCSAPHGGRVIMKRVDGKHGLFSDYKKKHERIHLPGIPRRTLDEPPCLLVSGERLFMAWCCIYRKILCLGIQLQSRREAKWLSK